MAQGFETQMKRSVKGKMLIIIVLLMVMLIINVVLGLVLQAVQAESNVKTMLTDNLNGSAALLEKGSLAMGGDISALTAEELGEIIDGNSCSTLVLDGSGAVLASYMKTGTAESSYPQYVQSAGQSSFYTTATGSGENRRVYAAKGIEGSSLTLVVCAPSKEYYSGLNTAFVINVALVLVMGFLAVLANSFFTKNITTPLGKIRGKIVEMSNGSLSGARVDINTDDELGVLASAVNNLSDYTNSIIRDIDHTAEEIARENLCVKPAAQYNGDFLPVQKALLDITGAMKEVVSNIDSAGREVSASSTQMSRNSSLLSSAADEGAATVKALNDSLNSVHEQINNSAEKAELARNLTEMSVDAINEGNEKMNKMLEAMREINSTSAEIANIIKTIQDISFQTNILSLNASIEAARAGAAGKGFAVVAGEVGSLAGKTAEAAKSTTKLIETSLKAVKHGMDMANESAEMLGMIVSKANESANVVEEISQISIKQAESIKQSIEDMNRISSSMTQVNNAARDCAESSTLLAAQSAVLEETVNRFVIDKTEPRRTAYTAPPAPSVSAPKPAPAPTPAPKPAPAPKAELSKPIAKPDRPIMPAPAKPTTAKPAPVSVGTATAVKPTSTVNSTSTASRASVASTVNSTSSVSIAKPSAPSAISAPKPTDDDAPVGKPVKTATMQPVKRTVRMDPDKY